MQNIASEKKKENSAQYVNWQSFLLMILVAVAKIRFFYWPGYFWVLTFPRPLSRVLVYARDGGVGERSPFFPQSCLPKFFNGYKFLTSIFHWTTSKFFQRCLRCQHEYFWGRSARQTNAIFWTTFFKNFLKTPILACFLKNRALEKVLPTPLSLLSWMKLAKGGSVWLINNKCILLPCSVQRISRQMFKFIILKNIQKILKKHFWANFQIW